MTFRMEDCVSSPHWPNAYGANGSCVIEVQGSNEWPDDDGHEFLIQAREVLTITHLQKRRYKELAQDQPSFNYHGHNRHTARKRMCMRALLMRTYNPASLRVGFDAEALQEMCVNSELSFPSDILFASPHDVIYIEDATMLCFVSKWSHHFVRRICFEVKEAFMHTKQKIDPIHSILC
eukprot:4378111-Amphidinium_carterae.1